MKNTKRSLLVSALSLLLCVSMLVGSTFAWFTDSVTSRNNVITSGNLDIEVQYSLDGITWNDLEGAKDLFQKDLWEPGHTEVVALKLTNKGSLALKYEVNMNATDVVGKTKTGEDIKLSEYLTVSTLGQQAGTIGDIALELAFSRENGVAYETTVPFASENLLKKDVQLAPGDEHYVILKVDMPSTVGNEANHDGTNIPSIEFDMNVLATQYTHEADSFDNQYDKDAEYKLIYKVNNYNDLKEIANEGGSVIVEGNIDIPQYLYSNGEEVNFEVNLAKDAILTVTPTAESKNKNTAFVAQNGGNITINGSGTLDMNYTNEEKEKNCWAIYANKSATVTVNGGTYLLGMSTDSSKGHIYSQNSAKIVINEGNFITSNPNSPIAYCINGFIEINGGYFENTANPNQALLTMANNTKYVNNQKITISGGTFVNWNPMSSAFARPWPEQNIPALIVLADGCEIVEEAQSNGDVWYTVVRK